MVLNESKYTLVETPKTGLPVTESILLLVNYEIFIKIIVHVSHPLFCSISGDSVAQLEFSSVVGTYLRFPGTVQVGGAWFT